MKKLISCMIILAMLICGAAGYAFAEADSFDPISKGDKGDRVVEIQLYLKEQGYLSGAADGDFGNGTEKAVISFQTAAGLEPTGIIDETTYYALSGIPSPDELEPIDLSRVMRRTLAGGNEHVIGILEDGTVIAVEDGDKNDDGQCEVSGWTDIISVSAGYYSSLGLRSNGTVVAASSNRYGECNVKRWTGIIDIAAGAQHNVGLRMDGTVVAAGDNENGQCNVSGWTGIKEIGVGSWHTLGVREDGTVVAAGYNEYGQCNVGDWKNIISVAGGHWFSVGLTADGRVVYAGGHDSDDKTRLNAVKSWSDVVYIEAIDSTEVMAITSDGRVLTTRSLNTPTGVVAAVFNNWHNWPTYLMADGSVDSYYEELDGVKLQMPDHYAVEAAEAVNEAEADTGVWYIRAYVDEFDLPTDDYYIVNQLAFSGKFSNSATTNSEVTAYLFCEKTDKNYEFIEIRLFEYGQYRVQNIFSDYKDYDIVMMDNNGTKYYMDGYISPDSADISIFDSEDVEKIIGALKRGGTVRFSITESDNSLNRYIITINDATGFDAAYDMWWQK